MNVYAGAAAVLVFGIGLLAVGKTWEGLGALVLGATVLCVGLAPGGSAKAVFFAIGLFVLAALLGFKAITNEVKGTALYFHQRGRGGWSEPVTREASPVKFRQATNVYWAGTITSVFVGAAAIWFSRKLDDCADDF